MFVALLGSIVCCLLYCVLALVTAAYLAYLVAEVRTLCAWGSIVVLCCVLVLITAAYLAHLVAEVRPHSFCFNLLFVVLCALLLITAACLAYLVAEVRTLSWRFAWVSCCAVCVLVCMYGCTTPHTARQSGTCATEAAVNEI